MPCSIALLPLPGKILEHIISKRLKNYLNLYDILTDRQHGFRKGHSTLLAIMEFLHVIYSTVNNNCDTYIIYLDLKKAFDTVSHDLLLCKLGNIGLHLNTANWFRSYLSGRIFRTRINDCTSASLPVSYGVPQGSILGPTLFSIYINDLIYFVDSEMIFYADDTVILDKNPTLLNHNLDIIVDWCNHNLLTINCRKSQWMRTNLTCKGAGVEPTFKFGKDTLSKTEEYRYLGILVDSNLNFNSHRQSMFNNVNFKLIFFKKKKKIVNLDAALLIYKVTILPLIEYADFVLDYNIKYINKKLQSLQNQGLLTVFNQHFLTFDNRDSTELLHRRANIIRLDHRRWIHMLSFLFNYKNNVDLLDVRDLPTRRHGGVLFNEINVMHHKVRQDPFHEAIIAWNNLPVDLHNIAEKEQFKNVLKTSIPNPYKTVT